MNAFTLEPMGTTDFGEGSIAGLAQHVRAHGERAFVVSEAADTLNETPMQPTPPESTSRRRLPGTPALPGIGTIYRRITDCERQSL